MLLTDVYDIIYFDAHKSLYLVMFMVTDSDYIPRLLHIHAG